MRHGMMNHLNLPVSVALCACIFTKKSVTIQSKNETNRKGSKMMNHLLQVFSDGLMHCDGIAIIITIATVASFFVVAADAAYANPRSVANMPIMR